MVHGPASTPASDLESELRSARQRILELERQLRIHDQAETALLTRQSLLFATVESTPDGILVLDEQGRVRLFNSPFADMWGMPESLRHPSGHDRILLHLLSQLDAPDAFRARIECLRGSREEDAGCLRLTDGRMFERFSRPILEAGYVTGRVWCFCDVTERETVQRELALARDKAEAAARSKNEFLATMSHEIRTPLNGLLGMIQLLEMTCLNEEQKYLARASLEAGRNLLHILSDVLTLAVLESGRCTVAQEPFDLDEVMRPVTASYQDAAGQKGLDFRYCVDPEVPARLIGDPGRLRQALFNLVGNAVKFTEHGAVRLEISLLPSPVPGKVRLLFTVSDTGVGIPDHKLASIFSPFTQGDGSSTRKYSGTGLGLTIVERLVRLMNGTLSIETEQDAGTTVCLALDFPLPSPVVIKSLPAPRRERAATEAAPNILVVEDDPLNRQFLVRLLWLKGFRVEAVDDGAEALAALAREPFDLVLMDVQLPGMNGMEATARIRTDTSGRFDPTLPILALTAHTLPGDRERFLAAGMTGYLAKPVGSVELFETIAAVLDNAPGEKPVPTC